jgi:hypothetical protein
MARLWCWILPLLLVASAGAQDEETVRDFRKLFRKFKEPVERVEAVLALEGIDLPDVVDALAEVVEDDDLEVRRAAVRVLAGLRSPASIASLEGAFAKAKRDSRAIGLLQVFARNGVAFTPESDAQERFEECLDDRDWELRVHAVRALPGACPDRAAEFLELARGDEELAVRCAALDAFGVLADEAAVDAALASLQAEAWQERACAVAILGAVRRQRSIGPLVERIQIEEGRLVSDMATALESLTGRAFGTRVRLWADFWLRVKDRYVMPTDQLLEAMRESERRDAAAYGAVDEGLRYHGIDTPSTRILFVVDVSGSMDNMVLDRERFDAEGLRSWKRIDVVRRELQRAVEGLGENVEFNILAFARDLFPWRKSPVAANALQKRAAMEWLDELKTVGGDEDKQLAEAGLVSAADLDAGRTNSHAALMYALGAIEEDGDPVDAEDYRLAVDTIFFLSDGVPSVGRYLEPTEILREVGEANRTRKVVIHALALGQFRRDFMERLARENGGNFVDLGK